MGLTWRVRGRGGAHVFLDLVGGLDHVSLEPGPQLLPGMIIDGSVVSVRRRRDLLDRRSEDGLEAHVSDDGHAVDDGDVLDALGALPQPFEL